jgi:hypothetical protein
MAKMLLINPRSRRRAHHRRRRHNPETRAQRSRAAKAGWRHRRGHVRRRRHNPWFNDHAGHRKAALKGWRGRRIHRRRHNPIRGGHLTNNVLIPAIGMGAGAVLLDVAYGYLPLPATLKTGTIGMVAKGVAAVALGMALDAMGQRKLGDWVAIGGLTVAANDMFKSAVQTFAPTLTLGYTGAGIQIPNTQMGMYLPHQESGGSQSPSNMGMYVENMTGSF